MSAPVCRVCGNEYPDGFEELYVDLLCAWCMAAIHVQHPESTRFPFASPEWQVAVDAWIEAGAPGSRGGK